MKGMNPHIVQYQGSKRKLAPQILEYMPMHFNRLIEPFAGMAAITVAVAKEQRAGQFILNDLNEPIMRVLEYSILTPKELLMEYTKVWQEQFVYPEGSVEHYYYVRDKFNNGERTAANMLYLLARCVKGAVRYGSNGFFNQSPDKRRNGTSPKSLESNIFQISNYLKNHTEFYSRDYRDILDMAQAGDIVYMDPPYQGVSNTRDSRYFSGIDFNEFVEAIEKLNRRGIDFLISYDGKCGDKEYGEELPARLNLQKVMLCAGTSSQSVLLGKKETTYEALYISEGLQKSNCKALSYPLFENLVV